MSMLTFSERKRFWKPSFTLIEILITISILGIIAGMLLVTLRSAQRDAYVARTQGTIKKLNDIIILRWEEFRYRSAKINVPPEYLRPMRVGASNDFQIPLSPREGARARMIVLRDVMRMEMPDRLTDILCPPSKYKLAAFTGDRDTSNDSIVYTTMSAPNIPGIDREVPSLLQSYRRKMVDESPQPPAPWIPPNGYTLKLNPYPADGTVLPVGKPLPTLEHQSAELLYAIVSTSMYQGTSALEFFRSSEMGDKDGDGFPEFWDAWGQPIHWIRWPAGYPSPLNDMRMPDPLDPLKTDWRYRTGSNATPPWMLVPLIVSAGPDGQFDTVMDVSRVSNKPCVFPPNAEFYGKVAYSSNLWSPAQTDNPSVYSVGGALYPYYIPDPYVFTDGYQMGALLDFDGDGDGSLDNITNYELVME